MDISLVTGVLEDLMFLIKENMKNLLKLSQLCLKYKLSSNKNIVHIINNGKICIDLIIKNELKISKKILSKEFLYE